MHLFFVSRDDNNDSGSTTKPDEINNFVWKCMNSWYYWQPNVPNLADSLMIIQTTYANFLNGKLQISFSILLFYQRGTIDRFSWIENNNEVVYSSKIAEVEKVEVLIQEFIRKTIPILPQLLL